MIIEGILPPEKLTDLNKSRLGTRFPTGTGGTLELVGYKDIKGRPCIFTCTTCSKDEGLWPVGSICYPLYKVMEGRIPCGCGKKQAFSPTQFEVLVLRRCKELNYKFEGFSENKVGTKTKINLFNPVTENRWDSCDVYQFLSKGVEDPALRNEKISNKHKKT